MRLPLAHQSGPERRSKHASNAQPLRDLFTFTPFVSSILTPRLPTSLVAALTVAIAFAGCGESQPRRTTVVSPPGVVATQDDLIDDEPYPDDEREGTRGGIDDEEDDLEPYDEEPERRTPSRPENVAEWTPEHFASARLENDPLLTDAIAHVGEQSNGDAKVVPMLVSLLAIEKIQRTPNSSVGTDEEGIDREEFEEDYEEAPRRIQVSSDAALAIIQALGRNDSPEALSALKDLLLGKLRAPLNSREMVREVVRTLAENIDSEREKILYILLTKPVVIAERLSQATSSDSADEESSRASSRRARFDDDFELGGTVDADWLQREVLREGAPAASRLFRTELAKFLNDPEVTIETAELLEEFLSREDSRNVGAQIVLLQNPHADSGTREQIEQTLTDGSRGALSQLLGLSDRASLDDEEEFDSDRFASTQPDGSRPSRRPSRQSRYENEEEEEAGRDEVDEEGNLQQNQVDYVEVASQLWTSDFVESLRSAAPTAGDNENRDEFDGEGDRGGATDSRTPTLLATIPLESARQALGELFEARAEEGPAPWTSIRLFGGDAVDPALLVLSKNMYHTGGTRRTTRTRRSSERGDDVDDESRQDEWARTMESFVGELCRQFRSAAAAQTAAPETEVPTADDSSPIKLHKDAQVVARYRMQWPQQIDGRLAGVSVAPLDVEYIRIEEENRVQRLLSTYRRQAGRAQERRISGGVWIDGFEKRDLRSIDIRITGEDGDLGLDLDDDADRRTRRRAPSRGRDRRDSRSAEDESRSDEPVPIIVEILSVCIQPPPSPESTDAANKAATAGSPG